MIYQAIERLVDYAIKKNIITIYDTHFVRNRLIDLLGLTSFEPCEAEAGDMTIDEILSPIVEYAVEKGIIADSQGSRDLFDTRIMGLLMPMPGEMVEKFDERYEISPDLATEWYYRFSQDTNYVRAGRIKKDLKWKYDCEYGTLDITINRSKPEKDPRDIAAAKTAVQSGYPKCQLCIENSGYAGHVSYTARQNLIPLPITVNNQSWWLQYSPYGYYNEHCIFFNNEHKPMKIDSEVFAKLLDIIDYLPHYFVGSNADLPIVGGSILSHEHFQGGGYSFAMDKADVEHEFTKEGFDDVKCGILKWPMSVIRLSSANKESLCTLAAKILSAWRAYSDPAAMIYSETEGTPHNTITPIARRDGDEYVIDLVLRNNLTTEERPMGLYHPAPELHHIKKENIGLIEVMGLAVLPARLAEEITLMEDAILSGKSLRDDPKLAPHADWCEDVVSRHTELSKDNVRAILENEIGEVFLKVLTDAGVFKRNEQGREAFLRFIDFV